MNDEVIEIDEDGKVSKPVRGPIRESGAPADYASALKVVWDNIDCQMADECRDTKLRCKGHAALLEMVDDTHIQNCRCDSRPRDGKPFSWVYPLCKIKRRRLRAAVGVDNG